MGYWGSSYMGEDKERFEQEGRVRRDLYLCATVRTPPRLSGQPPLCLGLRLIAAHYSLLIA